MTKSPPLPGPSPLFLQLIPALMLALFVTSVFWWNPFGHLPEHAYFETELLPEKSGEARFLANVDGTGLRLQKTVSMPLEGGKINHVRFPIPAGKLCAFIFTPFAGEGNVDIRSCQFAADNGEIVAELPPASIAHTVMGAHPLPDGSVRVPGSVGGTTTGIQHDLIPEIELAPHVPPPLEYTFLVFGGSLFAALGLIRLAARVDWRPRAAAFWRHVRLHPRRALLAAAAFSTVVSCFPVLFCGKSFVSPDNGMIELYEGFPTVPGAQGGRTENPTGADMGVAPCYELPASKIQHDALFHDGEFPFWNRYDWSGISLWSQCMSMFGDPFHWPAVLTGGAAWAWDFKFIATKLFFAFGIGLLAWATSRSLPASLLLALSAPYVGFFAYRFSHPATFALCYAPWVLLPWLEVTRIRGTITLRQVFGVLLPWLQAPAVPALRRIAGWSAVLVFASWEELNSGTAKEAACVILFLNLAGALALLFMRTPLGDRLIRLAVFAWANVLFLFLSAPLWLLFLDALLHKSWTFYDDVKVYQMQPGTFIGAFDDIFHRQFMRVEFFVNPCCNFFVLLGCAWAVVRARKLARDGSFLAVSILAVVVASIAFGVVPPTYLATIPLLKSVYHFDDTFSLVLFNLLFVLAGFGLRECHRRMRSAEWRGDWVFVLVLVGLLYAAYFGTTQAAQRVGTAFIKVGDSIPKSDFMCSYITGLALALAVFPWAWRGVRLRLPAAVLWALVAVAAFATLHYRHGMYLVTKFDLYTMNPKTRLDLRHVASPSVDQARALTAKEPGRVVGVDWLLTAGFNGMLDLETISGPEALENPQMRELVSALDIPQMWAWKLVVWHKEFDRVHRALDMLGVRYFLDKPGQGSSLKGTKFISTTDLDLVENPTAWPRAFFTDTVIAYHKPIELWRLNEDDDGRPFAALLPDDVKRLPIPPRDFNTRKVVPATGYRLTHNTTTFDIDAPSPGVAVLGEAWLPGDIEVTVDGEPAEVLRIDHAFRGVYLPKPGTHHIVFGYRPEKLDLALGIFGLGLAATTFSLLLLFRRRRSGTSDSPAGTVPAKSDLKECLTTP